MFWNIEKQLEQRLAGSQIVERESSTWYLVGCRVSDVDPGLSSIVPENSHCLTPATNEKKFLQIFTPTYVPTHVLYTVHKLGCIINFKFSSNIY